MKNIHVLLVVSAILVSYAMFAYDYSLVGKIIAGFAVVSIIVYIFMDSRKSRNNKKG